MDEQVMINKSTELSDVNLKRILTAIFQKLWLVIIAAIACAAIVLVATKLWVTPQYQASAVFYVNNSSISISDTTLSIESGDISASKSLVNTYIVILKDRVTLRDIIDYAGFDMHYTDLYDNISAESLNDTEVFKVVVTDANPEHAERLANAAAYILPKRIASIVDGTSVKIVSDALTPVTASSPNYTMNTMIGFLLGFVLAGGAIALHVMLDTTIRADDDIRQSCKYPILVSVPDMSIHNKVNSSYYSRSKEHLKSVKYAAAKQTTNSAVLGPDISFAASEAYKLLRTKIQFSFSDENDCRIIGLSSAISGEGKSLTAVNLAFALSQLNKKVLLVDCDMRRPTLAEKLRMLKQPGLSSYLTRQCCLEELVQPCGIKGNEDAFDVISAGQNPPNPTELLSSERMKKAMDTMRGIYEYVILDLPPVGEVSDAMAVAKEIDGMLIVVRQNFGDRNILTEAVQQFEFIDARILGIVFNGTSEYGSGYSRSYYKRYYKQYSNNYAGNNHPISKTDESTNT